MDRLLLFCGQTLTTFCGQILATDSWTFLWTDSYYLLWTDSCYRFVGFSVDRLLLLFCGQTCWSCWQNLWTDFSDKFWTDFVDKFVHICLTNFRDRFYRQTTNLDIEFFVDRICRQICTALTNIFSTYLLKRISKIFFSTRGRKSFCCCGTNFVLFWQTCWKEYHRFSFQQGGEKDRVNPQGKISIF